MRAWISLASTGVNTTAYAARQNDQMRVLDYLKRDIRRSSAAAVYDAGRIITTPGSPGTELRLTIPDYYADSREEDNSLGPNAAHAPSLTGDIVNYGAPLTVRYSTAGGAVIRTESGAGRVVANDAGAFALSFSKEAKGTVRSRITYEQPMQGPSARALRRNVEITTVPRFIFRK